MPPYVQELVLDVACQGERISPAVLAAVAVLGLDPAVPMSLPQHALALLAQRAGSCPPGPFLGLLTALLRGPPSLKGEQDKAAWDRHGAICSAACTALLGVADTGASAALLPDPAVPASNISPTDAVAQQSWPGSVAPVTRYCS